MKLKTKILLIFTVALVINIFAAFFGLTYVLDSLSTRMMKKQAENITMFLQRRIMVSAEEYGNKAVPEEILSDFIIAKQVSDDSRGFELKKILLIKPDFMVEAAYPEEEKGESYEGHEDIRSAFLNKNIVTVDETNREADGTLSKDIDVVSYFTLSDGTPRVIEVKLDFTQSIALLEAQYRTIETGAIITALVILTSLLSVLLLIIGRTAIRPVIKVTSAMNDVGNGNLDIKLPEDSGDEFGMLAKRFNEMVAGLKEKFRLYSYVSKGTITAIRESLDSGNRKASRKNLVLFFSDIRGFTTYSENRDPEAVITILNRILSLQSEIIHKHGGDVDKYVGDEVMAIFSSASHAIEAAIDIQESMNRDRESLDQLHIGIGIHTGEVMQGDVGSDNMKDFTVIGDNVNTAARLESEAGGDEILVSENIARSEGVSISYLLKPRGELKLKGKEIKIGTYNVTGRKEVNS